MDEKVVKQVVEALFEASKYHTDNDCAGRPVNVFESKLRNIEFDEIDIPLRDVDAVHFSIEMAEYLSEHMDVEFKYGMIDEHGFHKQRTRFVNWSDVRRARRGDNGKFSNMMMKIVSAMVRASNTANPYPSFKRQHDKYFGDYERHNVVDFNSNGILIDSDVGDSIVKSLGLVDVCEDRNYKGHDVKYLEWENINRCIGDMDKRRIAELVDCYDTVVVERSDEVIVYGDNDDAVEDVVVTIVKKSGNVDVSMNELEQEVNKKMRICELMRVLADEMNEV